MKCNRRFMHGKRRKRSPLHKTATAHTTDPTVKKKSNKLKVESSGHPRYIGGSAPNPAKTAVNIAKKVYKKVKSLI